MKNIILIALFAIIHKFALAEENQLTEVQVAHVLYKAGFPIHTVSVMTCIAKYESNFNSAATHTNRNKTVDFGLLQINDVWMESCKLNAHGLKNPYLNAKCGKKVYQQQGFKAWSAFKKYKNTCLAYRVNFRPSQNLLVSETL